MVDRVLPTSFYECQARNLIGDLVSMSEFAGKVVLVENTATL